MEAGLDSLGSVELRNSLSSRFSVELAPTCTLDYPTVGALAQHIQRLIVPETAAAVTGAIDSAWSGGSESGMDAGVHVVGMSCTYPGVRLDAYKPSCYRPL